MPALVDSLDLLENVAPVSSDFREDIVGSFNLSLMMSRSRLMDWVDLVDNVSCVGCTTCFGVTFLEENKANLALLITTNLVVWKFVMGWMGGFGFILCVLKYLSTRFQGQENYNIILYIRVMQNNERLLF